ncbi:DUF4180 domain-containing protein [Paenilisteria rocourtiae]|uniref:Uncharacterized protein DUF4180 n=1 Tax=Listeria rocourtiae TaxID=647910 RepID=A0A4R6ZMC7_9LIST|nr:DUF4180 domain-containing protein [Listeria rocourtiae]EUJ51629.1 hypothetical protein PROCOU_02094 [Listeria rocourtiae FSL F6-920]MBC1434467.1 DUF4180 domain-containing protein [Listeria rocourtiae]MBC1603873.1 DUF4180 domain-containing protein [Listeria rocourtiae]TDR53621.1 uncharacterized protein DUF4180 [Listeria rocourtiae]
MEIQKLESDGIARIKSDEVIIKDAASMLDFVMSVQYETTYRKILIDKAIILEDFFDLKTRLLGDAFQKLVTYQLKMAIVGDFSMYSENFKDYMYESNKGSHVYFVATEEEAVDKLR